MSRLTPRSAASAAAGSPCFHRAYQALGIRAVFIDDLQRYVGVRYSSERSSLRQSFVGLAAKLGVAIVGGYCVTRPDRKDRRARWSDLRGTVAEDPDLLILVHPQSEMPPAAHLHLICGDRPGVVTEQLYMRPA